jgi:hypothetical protein
MPRGKFKGLFFREVPYFIKKKKMMRELWIFIFVVFGVKWVMPKEVQ